ncbi:MAG: CHC2 zinc finger domain-containing protein [Paracoccaceae bacterium]
MSTFIDFEEVKAINPIAQVAQNLGLELKKAGNALRGPCPSGEGGERALAITPSKGVWYSFGLNKGGDVLALVQLVNDCTVKEAAKFLSESAPLEKAERSSPERGAERGFAPLEYLQADHPAVEALGMEARDAERLGIGYASRGTMRGLVAIPVRTDTGSLVGYIGVSEARLPPKWSEL